MALCGSCHLYFYEFLQTSNRIYKANMLLTYLEVSTNIYNIIDYDYQYQLQILYIKIVLFLGE